MTENQMLSQNKRKVRAQLYFFPPQTAFSHKQVFCFHQYTALI